jgi:hypothetical protein
MGSGDSSIKKGGLGADLRDGGGVWANKDSYLEEERTIQIGKGSFSVVDQERQDGGEEREGSTDAQAGLEAVRNARVADRTHPERG